MEQVSSGEVLSIVEERLRVRREKVSIYPEFVESLSRHVMLRRLVNQIRTAGAEFYIHDGKLERSWFPLEERFLPVYGAIKQVEDRLNCVGADIVAESGRNFMQIPMKIHGKPLYVCLGDVNQPFISFDSEPKPVELEVLTRIKRYVMRLTSIGLRPTPSLSLDLKTNHEYVVFNYKEPERRFQSTYFDIRSFSPYRELVRLLSEEELLAREREMSQRLMWERTLELLESMAQNSTLVYRQGEFRLYETRPELLEPLKPLSFPADAVSRVADRFYILYEPYEAYRRSGPHLSLPIMYLKALKYLQASSVEAFVWTRLPCPYPETPIPKTLITVFGRYPWYVVIAPRKNIDLPIPRAKTIITKKRIIVVSRD